MSKMRTLISTALLSLAAITTLVFADDDQERARELSRTGAIVPLERITEQARARGIETILEVELESDKRGHHYEIEGLDAAGEVRKLRYDATIGEPIEKRTEKK